MQQLVGISPRNVRRPNVSTSARAAASAAFVYSVFCVFLIIL